MKRHPYLALAIAVLAFLIIIVGAGVWLGKEPLRRSLESRLNDQVEGYRFVIGGLDLHPIPFSVRLRDIAVKLSEQPELSVAVVPSMVIGVNVLPLLTGTIEAQVELDSPVLSLTREQIKAIERNSSKEDLKEETQAWQDRVRNATGFKVALLVTNGRVTYEGTPSPIRVQHADLKVENITNRPSDGQSRPSSIRLSAKVFDRARLEVEGDADFLAVPLPHVEARVDLKQLQLDDLKPNLEKYHVRVHGGILSVNGRMQYAGQDVLLAAEQFHVENTKIDYLHASAAEAQEKRQLKRVAEEAKEIHQSHTIIVKIQQGSITQSEIGFTNHGAEPQYRSTLTNMDVEINNMTNRPEEGIGDVSIKGNFMGSGPTVIKASFRPEKPRPDFALTVKITKTDVTKLNPLLRAYGRVDVTKGTFAFFSQIEVKNNEIRGYVKPFLKDVEVYDPMQDKDKALGQRLYEAVVGEIVNLLKNVPREQVATKTDVSGPVGNPRANTWDIIENLVQNAFFKAILPGFEKSVT
ncbi:hypothetical protein W02_32080 [Nitrospira sp. KM1]|uniref:DUF748 domain-containing protein n=1 Tax=Nitrospira sp. KM1 TaxID=1936990 RepID=UPI0013A7551B|nr:DUF748 domain-containing protein [Nitrospira sp. KM1]BCA56068.1 hypothetical protein W02_32080 [Nitrospira sp. KM1]